MQILFLGPPGSGKGTQSQRLAERMKIAYFSSGDIFRQEMANNTALGKKLKYLWKPASWYRILYC